MNAPIEQLIANLPPQGTKVYRRKVLNETLESLDLSWNDVSSVLENEITVPKPKRGSYDLSMLIGSVKGDVVEQFQPEPIELVAERQTQSGLKVLCNIDANVPVKDELFVPWGEFGTITNIIASGKFFPFSISGPSGNGKTLMVKQACAKLNREYIRVQVSSQTDEDDLIGGLRLINGDTVFAEGPVIAAMRRGAILLIDEMDRATNKIMCLQGILEGEPVLVKKTGEIVSPAPGFNVIATMNTKGRGSDDGRYIAASVIDDAFLERFKIMIEQPFPTKGMEKKIISKHLGSFKSLESSDEGYVNLLADIAEKIRKEAEEGEDIISTRRLCHIAEAYAILGDDRKAFGYCVARFESQTRDAWVALYTSMRPDLENYEKKKKVEAERNARAKNMDDDAASIAARVLGQK